MWYLNEYLEGVFECFAIYLPVNVAPIIPVCWYNMIYWISKKKPTKADKMSCSPSYDVTEIIFLQWILCYRILLFFFSLLHAALPHCLGALFNALKIDATKTWAEQRFCFAVLYLLNWTFSACFVSELWSFCRVMLRQNNLRTIQFYDQGRI